MDKKDFFRAEKEATSPKLTGRKLSNSGLNAGMTSPTAAGAVPISGASSAAPGSTNSPAPSLDALTNSVGSDQGQRMFSSQNPPNVGQLTNTSDTHNIQFMSSHRTRQRTPSTVSNSSTPYNTYDQTRLTNPTPPPRTAASISNNTMPFPDSSKNNSVTSNNEGNYNLTHHMPQSNFPHFQGLAHIRGPVEGFGFSSHLLGHSEDDKTNVLDDSCSNPTNNSTNYNNDNNINNYASNNVRNSGIIPPKGVTNIQQGIQAHSSNKRGSNPRRGQNQALYNSQNKNPGTQHDNHRGVKNSDQNNASIWYGGSQDYSASPPLSNVATTMPSYMFPCPTTGQLIQQQQTQQIYISQSSNNPPSTTSGGYMITNDSACLKVSLPPENHPSSHSGVDIIPRIGMDDSIGDGTYTESSYGSIPQLEASPRRYRTHGEDEFQYDVTATSLGVPTFLNKTLEKDKKSNKNSESPPKLPERTPKSGIHSSISPPPLPPKKQTNNLAPTMPSLVMEAKEENTNRTSNEDAVVANECPTEDDIYDFPPEPTISGAGVLNQKNDKTCVTEILKGNRNNNREKVARGESNKSSLANETGNINERPLITVEELSKMSVMELNEKMMSGHLPSHLKGMSIFELVEYIAKQMTKDNSESLIKEASNEPDEHSGYRLSSAKGTGNSIKPSFSDNFVSNQMDSIHSGPDTNNSSSKGATSTLSRFGIPSPINRLRNTESINSMSPGPPTAGQRLDGSDEEGKAHQNFEFPPHEDQDMEGYPRNQVDDPATSRDSMENKKNSNIPEDWSVSSRDNLSGQNSLGNSEPNTNNPSQYDRYAVFRELELDDAQGWSSSQGVQEDDINEEPHDDIDSSIAKHEVNDFKDSFCQQRVENESQQNLESEQHYSAKEELPEQEEDATEEKELKEHPVCSSEGSPCSRSEESGLVHNKSVSDDQTSDVFPPLESNAGQLRKSDNKTSNITHDIKRDSQIPIYNVSDDQNDPQEEDSVEQGHNLEKEIDAEEEQTDSFNDAVTQDSSKNDSESKKSLKENFFSSKIDDTVTTKQWTTFDDSEPWNTSSNEARRSSLNASDDCNNAFTNFQRSHRGTVQEARVPYNNITNTSSRGVYSATLGRQNVSHRKQMQSINTRRNVNPGMEHQNISFDSVSYKGGRISAASRETRTNNYFQDWHASNVEADKMNMYLESRGMIPLDHAKSSIQNHNSSRRHNTNGRDETIGETRSGAVSQVSTTHWPPSSRYPYSNHPSLDSPRASVNDTRGNTANERNDLRRTPNPFNDNFSPGVIQQNIHGANMGMPPQQIPQTLHSSSALHLEEAYLQQVSPIYLEQHSLHHSQLQDTDAFQCCENYSESPQSSSNFQAYRYVEGAVMDSNDPGTSITDGIGTEHKENDAFTQQNNGSHYPSENILPSQSEVVYGSDHNNEIPFSAGVDDVKCNYRDSSVGSSASHDNNGAIAFSKADDEVFQVDRSSLENPTFKVHAKVIPSATQRESTNIDPDNYFENFDNGESEDCSIPKSDSINIFSIQSDPFDDAFFKF